MKGFLAAIALACLSFGASAATTTYNVTSGVTGNAYTAIGGGYAADLALTNVYGTLIYDDVANTLTGNIQWRYLYPAQNVNTDYAGDWLVGTLSGNLAQSSVVCTDSGANLQCPQYAAANPVGAITVLSGAYGLTPGNIVKIKQLIGGSPAASSANGFTLQQIPVPAAVWLFGSAIGLMGVMRRKLTA